MQTSSKDEFSVHSESEREFGAGVESCGFVAATGGTPRRRNDDSLWSAASAMLNSAKFSFRILDLKNGYRNMSK